LRVALGRLGELLCLGLWLVLREDHRLSVAGIDLDFEELMLMAREARPPAVVVLEASRVQPGPFSRLRDIAPETAYVALTSPERRRSTPSWLLAGVAELIPVDTRATEIRAAILRAAASRPELTATPTAPPPPRRFAPAVLEELTSRQEDVLRLLSEGHSRATIAYTLHIEESTVSSHIKKAYKILGVSRRAEIRGVDFGSS